MGAVDSRLFSDRRLHLCLLVFPQLIVPQMAAPWPSSSADLCPISVLGFPPSRRHSRPWHALSRGQQDLKGRPLPGFALGADEAVVLVDDAPRDGQAQAGA